MLRGIAFCLTGATLAFAATSAKAVDITLNGLILDTCILTLTTPGVLSPSVGGTTVSSEQAGGAPATLAVVATGSSPTINFGVPDLNGPSGSEDATTEIRYTSTGGANQPYTSGASERDMTGLLDVFTIHGRVTNEDGFAAGTYTVTTVATCEQ